MAVIQTTLIWIAYAVAVAVLALVASIFVFTYQKSGDRSALVSIISVITLTSLLATALLLPVDIALVSSTSSSRLGRKKDWATPEKVHDIVHTLKIVYYTLYSWDALLCLIVVPFTYFFYEEQEDVEDEGHTFGQMVWGALKYTLSFIALVVILFLIGFFVPVRAQQAGEHLDLDYFKKLLSENHGERALTFSIGLLTTIGTLLYVLYAGPGFALFPISLIKSAPAISAPSLAASTANALEGNRERQRQLEARNMGREDGMEPKDRRELDALLREERTLVRRERLASEAQGDGQGWLIKSWTKTQAVFRPLKLLGGILLLVVALVIWVSMLLTGIDKAKNSICKAKCGYILGHVNIFNPINWLFVLSAKVFPVDYVLVTLLVLFFFFGSVVGIGAVGIRFLWLRLFQIRKGHTSPQAMLMALVLLVLISLAINFALVTVVAPQYAHFGPQTFCTHAPRQPGGEPDCRNHTELIQPCSEVADSHSAAHVCTPSFASTFLDRVNINYPYFGAFNFWAQFVFLALFLIVFVTSLVRTPKLDEDQLDADAEEAEEEGLLASTGRRFGATWQDITGMLGHVHSSVYLAPD
ncbi:MAG: hypothetical protein M1815_001363 [Lichina confinis]|nr:MAG: hypothetical protein M1815_001363 [Lichina confinis]